GAGTRRGVRRRARRLRARGRCRRGGGAPRGGGAARRGPPRRAASDHRSLAGGRREGMSVGGTPVHDLRSASPEDTEALGARLGRAARGGELLGLVGDLGAGQTVVVRGGGGPPGVRGSPGWPGADPVGLHRPSSAPAMGFRGGGLPLQHVALYRCAPPLSDTPFLREALYGPGVAAVEWFERILSV